MSSYAVVDERDGFFVLSGPIEWRPRFFANIIVEETEQAILIPKLEDIVFPYYATDGISIRKCKIVKPSFDPLFQQLEGPFWSLGDDDCAVATYAAKEKNGILILEDLKQRAAERRRQKENIYLEINIEQRTFFIDTSKSSREALIAKYITMDDNSVIKWKVRNLEWLELNRQEVQIIIKKIDEYIQSIFDEENSVITLALQAKSLEEFMNIYENSGLNPQETLRGKIV